MDAARMEGVREAHSMNHDAEVIAFEKGRQGLISRRPRDAPPRAAQGPMIDPLELSPRELLERYPSREAKIGRIKEIERTLEKMELEDEQNDPVLIQGHIRLTQGYRIGCGVFVLCLAAMTWRAVHDGHRGYAWLMYLFLAAGVVTIARGLLYRPDPQLIRAAYVPHRGSARYRALADQMDQLARALSQGLRAEDEA